MSATGPTSRDRDERRRLAQIGERWTSLSFAVSIAGALGLAVVYWRGGQPQLEGLFLALALGGIGIGLVVWARYFMPHRPVTEERHDLGSSDEEIAAFRDEFAREEILARRGLLVKMAGAALVTLGAALVFPIRSLGPRPGKGFKATPFRAGLRLVDEGGQPIRAADIVTDGLITAFPEGHTDSAGAPTVLIRPRSTIRPRPGREDWTPDGLVAYSKLCTHVGCPVGLYQTGSSSCSALPPVHLRCARRGPPGLRAGVDRCPSSPSASTTRASSWPRVTSRPHRPRLLGPGPLMRPPTAAVLGSWDAQGRVP
ncbi:MAG: hypothetical protein WKF43_08960 [Acidimicrobiales bacterium]